MTWVRSKLAIENTQRYSPRHAPERAATWSRPSLKTIAGQEDAPQGSFYRELGQIS
jgi:hypothetical protein